MLAYADMCSAGEKKELMTQMRALEKQMTELEEEKVSYATIHLANSISYTSSY